MHAHLRHTTQTGLEPVTSAVTGRRSNQLSYRSILIFRADDRTRTDNLLITNQLLCQLSHIGVCHNDYDLATSIAVCL